MILTETFQPEQKEQSYVLMIPEQSIVHGTDTEALELFTGRIPVERLKRHSMDENIKKQIMAIAETGLTNMFDVAMVLVIAKEFDFDELASWLPKHKKEYSSFILYGE